MVGPLLAQWRYEVITLISEFAAVRVLSRAAHRPYIWPRPYNVRQSTVYSLPYIVRTRTCQHPRRHGTVDGTAVIRVTAVGCLGWWEFGFFCLM